MFVLVRILEIYVNIHNIVIKEGENIQYKEKLKILSAGGRVCTLSNTNYLNNVNVNNVNLINVNLSNSNN